MANTKSLKKIQEYLDTKKGITTPSQICKEVNLRIGTIRECVSILEESGKIKTLSNGKTMLIKINGDENANN